MKQLLTLILSKIIAGYNLMNVEIPNLPYLIHTSVPDSYLPEIYSVINDFNRYSSFHKKYAEISPSSTVSEGITEQTIACHLIKVTPFELSGSSKIEGVYMGKKNQWLSANVTISLSDKFENYPNTLYNVFLHELLHTKGLYHSKESRSVMNSTLILNSNFYPEYDSFKYVFTYNDLLGLRAY